MHCDNFFNKEEINGLVDYIIVQILLKTTVSLNGHFMSNV